MFACRTQQIAFRRNLFDNKSAAAPQISFSTTFVHACLQNNTYPSAVCALQHLPRVIPESLAHECPTGGYALVSPALGARQRLRPCRLLASGGLAFRIHWIIHLGVEQLGWFSPCCSSSLRPAVPAKQQLLPHAAAPGSLLALGGAQRRCPMAWGNPFPYVLPWWFSQSQGYSSAQGLVVKIVTS